MKKNLKILLFIFTASLETILVPTIQDPTKLFMGSIQFPMTLNFDLCLYYKGQKVTNEDSKENLAQFSFLESQYTQDIYILICENLSYQTENNTIQNLCISNNNYKCYKLLAFRTYDENNKATSFSWDAQEYELPEGAIPDNTLVFVFNPHYIQGISIHSWKIDSTLRLIPTIIINQELTADQLKRAMTIARLAAIDIDTVHKKINSQSAQSQSAQALLTLIQ